MERLHTMALVHTVGAFERFLKETAAICIDNVADFVLDGRLDEFSLKGTVAGAHLAAGSLGNALCESRTWLKVEEINNVFGRSSLIPSSKGATSTSFPVRASPRMTNDSVSRSSRPFSSFATP
jgi:hypothetical protein